MPTGCQWSTTTALTKTQLQYWQDTSWDWQPLSSEGHWKPYPSPQPSPALLLPQPPLRLCPHTQRRMQAFCTNLRGAVGRLLGASTLLASKGRSAENSLSDLQVTFWGMARHMGTVALGPTTPQVLTQSSDGHRGARVPLPNHLPLPIQCPCPLGHPALIVALVCLDAVEDLQGEGAGPDLLHLDAPVAAALRVRGAGVQGALPVQTHDFAAPVQLVHQLPGDRQAALGPEARAHVAAKAQALSLQDIAGVVDYLQGDAGL